MSKSILRKDNAFGGGRTAKGLVPQVSRTALAKRLGTSKSVVSYILLGRHEPSMDLLMRMADELKIPASLFVELLQEQKTRYKREHLPDSEKSKICRLQKI